MGASIGEEEEHERDGRDREKRDPTSEPSDQGSRRERTGLYEKVVHDVVLAEAQQDDPNAIPENSQPIGFRGRREAINAPTVAKVVIPIRSATVLNQSGSVSPRLSHPSDEW